MVDEKEGLLFELIQYLDFTNQITKVDGRKFFGGELFDGCLYKALNNRIPLKEWEEIETGRHLAKYQQILTKDDLLNMVDFLKGVEGRSLVDNHQDSGIHAYDLEIPLATRLETALVISGEGSRQSSLIPGMEGKMTVSLRVLEWAIKVVVKDRGGKESDYLAVYSELAKREEEEQWHWLRQRLPDGAIEGLIKKLGKNSQELPRN